MDMSSFELKEKMSKLAMLAISLSIGLFSSASLDAYYITVLVQSLNNMYDANPMSVVSSRTQKLVILGVFLTSLFCFIISILHFIPDDIPFKILCDGKYSVYIISALLSLPVIVCLVETIILIKNS